MEVRGRIKCANTSNAKQLLVNKLKLSKDKGHCIKTMLEEATEKSWKSVYEPKEAPIHDVPEVDEKLAKWRKWNASKKTTAPN